MTRGLADVTCDSNHVLQLIRPGEAFADIAPVERAGLDSAGLVRESAGADGAHADRLRYLRPPS